MFHKLLRNTKQAIVCISVIITDNILKRKRVIWKKIKINNNLSLHVWTFSQFLGLIERKLGHPVTKLRLWKCESHKTSKKVRLNLVPHSYYSLLAFSRFSYLYYLPTHNILSFLSQPFLTLMVRVTSKNRYASSHLFQC